MGMYVNGNLMSGERVTHNFKWHWSYYVLPVVTIPVFIGVPWLLLRILDAWTSELAITDRRLIGKVGFISRRTFDFPLDTVSSVQIDQGILGRIFNFGKLRFKNDGEVMSIPLSVGSPAVIRNVFSEAQHNFKANLFAGRIAET